MVAAAIAAHVSNCCAAGRCRRAVEREVAARFDQAVTENAVARRAGRGVARARVTGVAARAGDVTAPERPPVPKHGWGRSLQCPRDVQIAFETPVAAARAGWM